MQIYRSPTLAIFYLLHHYEFVKPNKSPKNKNFKTALLIIDMLNTLDFPEGPQLAKQARPVAQNILKLKKRLQKKKDVAIVYVNDNFGNWNSDWQQVFETCAAEESRGKDIAHILRPEPQDFFILKPRHSAFYSTNLEVFLRDLGVRRLIITGIAGDICVLFTAHDAHMRDYEVIVPQDCVASNTATLNKHALHLLKTSLKIPCPDSSGIRN